LSAEKDGVECNLRRSSVFVKIFDLPDGGSVIQIDTEGSTDRANPGKQSQTIQMGREAAQELFEILKRTYGLS
jgi:hypothetical protein